MPDFLWWVIGGLATVVALYFVFVMVMLVAVIFRKD